MLEELAKEYEFPAKKYRICAWFALFVGLGLLMTPLSQSMRFIPFIDYMLEKSILFTVWSVAFLLSACISGIIYALVWFKYDHKSKIYVILGIIFTGCVLSFVHN